MAQTEPTMWFAPKRFGYGAGLPIAWQGWALLAGYLTIVFAGLAMTTNHHGPIRAAGIGTFLIATVTLIFLSARRTRGGWKWRWGSSE